MSESIVIPQKTALITGAAGGMGAEVARRLSAMNYHVLLVDVNAKALNDLAANLSSAEAIVTDLTDRAACHALSQRIENMERTIDVAFVNAGVVRPGLFIEQSEADIELQLELNLRSTLYILQACARHMQKRRSGHIISTVSMGGILPVRLNSIYTATKFGLRGLMTVLRDELKDHGVAVSGLYPSGVDTPMLRYEATHNGCGATFVGTPLSVRVIGDAFVKVLKSKVLEVYLPYGDSLFARIIGFFPRFMYYFYPLLDYLGERGKRAYLKKIQSESTEKEANHG